VVPPIQPLHSWDLEPAEARRLQEALAGGVDVRSPLGEVRTVAAADVSYDRHASWLCAAVVVTPLGQEEVIATSSAVAPAVFPYVPGLLSFREAPAILEAFARLQAAPDVLLVDGQGIAHPRRLGLASHLGLWLGIPTIGCAKSRLIGEFEEPGPRKGDWTPLWDRGEMVGAVVRTRERTKPLFVSPGHLCDLASAVRVVLAATPRYRLPAPARLAHQRVNELRRHAANQRG